MSSFAALLNQGGGYGSYQEESLSFSPSKSSDSAIEGRDGGGGGMSVTSDEFLSFLNWRSTRAKTLR